MPLGETLTEEDKRRLKKSIEDWTKRMPCDWAVCGEAVSTMMEDCNRLQVDDKVLMLNLLCMANLCEENINEDEPGFDFDEIFNMAEVMTAQVMQAIKNKRASENMVKAMADSLGMGFIVQPGRRP